MLVWFDLGEMKSSIMSLIIRHLCRLECVTVLYNQLLLLISQKYTQMLPQMPHSPTHTLKKYSLHQYTQKKSRFFIKQNSFSQESQLDQSDSSLREGQSSEGSPAWPSKEDMALISLFKKQGGNWQQISKQLQHKSDFEAKRHFLQIFRKVIENMNKKLRKLEQHQIRFNRLKVALKHISLENKQGISLELQEEISTIIDQSLLNEQGNSESFKESVKSAQKILLILKKQRRKTHNQGTNDTLIKEKIPSQRQEEGGYISDSSSAFDQPKEPKHCQIRNVENGYADQEVLSGNALKGIGIKDLLRESGALQTEELPYKSGATNFQESIPSSSQNLNNQSYQHFYEQSQLQRDCYWKKSCSELNQMG